MSKVGEFILGQLSRDPKKPDYISELYKTKHEDVNVYMNVLEDTFPHFREKIAGKNVLDIGCGEGLETIAISRLGAKKVWGIDIRVDTVQADELRTSLAPEHYVEFSRLDAARTSFPNKIFDSIVTLGSFEHFNYPFEVLKECRRILRDDGRIFLTSSVWSHPWGAHMSFFTKVPWVQFLFSEKTIMNVRSLYRSDGARRFSEVEGGLNKAGIIRFKRYVQKLSLTVEYLKLRPVRGVNIATKVPIVNEFFTSLISSVLRK